MVAVLDILQSIPVLSFLPPVVLAMVALVPGHQMGIEMGVILLIFTGQVWNLAFSFYSSLKSIPREMVEASRIYRYSAWQRFWQLEMPYSAIGLVWNSIVSVAGGWFALIFCETFTMGDRNFQLPGLGSYIQTATYAGDVRALVSGIAVVVLIVVATDQLIWRPLIAWSDKFKFEQVESADRVTSPILELLRRSTIFNSVPGRIWSSMDEPICRRMAETKDCRCVQPLDEGLNHGKASPALWALAMIAIVVVGWGATQAVLMLGPSPGQICDCCSRARAQLFCASMPPCSSLLHGQSPSALPSDSTLGWRASFNHSRRFWPRFRPRLSFPSCSSG